MVRPALGTWGQSRGSSPTQMLLTQCETNGADLGRGDRRCEWGKDEKLRLEQGGGEEGEDDLGFGQLGRLSR